MDPPRAASSRATAGPEAGSGAPRGRRRGPRTIDLAFAAAALLFCAPYLRPGKVLLPTSLATMPPWSEAGVAPPPSNDLMADALVLTLPERVRNGESLRRGELPFWNPRIFGGYPHLAMIQNDALYPPSAAFDVVEPVSGMAWSVALHLALAGALAFRFLAGSGVSTAGSLAGGVAFALNGLFLVRASAPSYVFSGTWLPLLLSGARRLGRGGRLRDGLGLAVGVALALLGGHPQIVVLELVAASAYAAWCAGDSARVRGAAPAPAIAAAAGRLAAATMLGASLVAFQLLPFAELLRHSARTAIPLADYLASALPPPALVQAIVPDVFGHPVDGDWWFGELAPLLDGRARGERAWAFNYSGENLFTGVAPLALAAAALARPRRRREVAFLAGLGALALATLMVPPMLAIAWLALPGFGASRPDRVLFLWIAAVSLLAGHGVDSIAPTTPGLRADARPARRRREGLLLPVAGVLLAAAAWWIVPSLANAARRTDLASWLHEAQARIAAARRPIGGQLAMLAAELGACAAIAAASARGHLRPGTSALLWTVAIALPNAAFGWRFNPVQPTPVLGTTATERIVVERPEGSRLARIVSRLPALPANVPDLLGVDDANGASAAGLDRYVALVGAFDPNAVSKMKYFPAFRDPGVATGALADLLSLGVAISDRPLASPWQVAGEEDGLVVSRHPAPAPRHRVVEDVTRVDDDAEALRRLSSPGFDARRAAIVAGAEPPPLAETTDPGAKASVEVEREEAHRIDLRVNAPRGGLLVSGEVDYPGWEASVDGTPAPVLRANVAFRGVAVSPGTHRVSFAFVPRSFHAGLVVSLLAALAFAGFIRRRD